MASRFAMYQFEGCRIAHEFPCFPGYELKVKVEDGEGGNFERDQLLGYSPF